MICRKPPFMERRMRALKEQQASKRANIISGRSQLSSMNNLTSQIALPKQISLAHPLMLQAPQISPLQPRRCRLLMPMLANGGRHLKDFSSWIQMKTKDDNSPC